MIHRATLAWKEARNALGFRETPAVTGSFNAHVGMNVGITGESVCRGAPYETQSTSLGSHPLASRAAFYTLLSRVIRAIIDSPRTNESFDALAARLRYDLQNNYENCTSSKLEEFIMVQRCCAISSFAFVEVVKDRSVIDVRAKFVPCSRNGGTSLAPWTLM